MLVWGFLVFGFFGFWVFWGLGFLGFGLYGLRFWASLFGLGFDWVRGLGLGCGCEDLWRKTYNLIFGLRGGRTRLVRLRRKSGGNVDFG